MRYSNGQIEHAKMLRRRLSALENVSAPPLSRVKLAAELFLLSGYALLRGVVRRAYWKMLDRTLCPHCHGQGTGYFFRTTEPSDEVSLTKGNACKLCHGKTYIGWKERESVKWGRALFEYRMSLRMSHHMMSAMTGVIPSHIAKHESGHVPLDEWPSKLYEFADLQLDREAAGHVSTT